MQPGAYPNFPGGGVPMATSMPGTLTTARVLLYVAGGIWALRTVLALVGLTSAAASMEELQGEGTDRGTAYTILIIGLLLSATMSTLHILPGATFGRGGPATRTTAIIAGSVNSLLGLLSVLGSFAGAASGGNPSSPLFALLWLATGVMTVVFCAQQAGGQWFNRQRY